MKKYLFPLFGLVLGAAGFLVRRWQLAAAFEPETGLVTPGHPATAWLTVIALLAAAGGLLCALSCWRYRTGKKLLTPGSQVVRGLLTIPAALYVAAGALTIVEELPLELAAAGTLLAAYLPVLLGVALAAGGVCMLTLLWHAPEKEGEPKQEQVGRRAVAAMLPGAACCLMLVYYYHENANNPVVMGYMWMEFAMIAAMLAWYSFARLRFGSEKVLRPCWFSLLCIVFQMIPLADENPAPCQLLLLANLVWFVVRCWQLLDGMEAQDAQG